MPDEAKYEYLDPVGVQNDGEPVAVVEAIPEPVLEPEPKAEDAPEPEKTPEEVEEHKRQTGSARAKAKLAEAKEQNRLLLERLERLEAKGSEPAKAQAVDPSEPVLENFETFADYNKAAIRYEAQKIVQEQRAQEQTAKVTQSWEAKKEAARAELPDFDEVMEDMIQPAPVVIAVMSESEHTAKIAYHLAQHPEEMKKINQMSPPAAALAVARIEAGFITPTKKEVPKSKAPAPINPVAARSAVPVSDPYNSRFETF